MNIFIIKNNTWIYSYCKEGNMNNFILFIYGI